MGIAVRHIGRATLLGAGALATTLAAEVMAARRHQFVPSQPPLEISGTIGPEDGEPLTLVVLGDSSVAGVGADAAEDTLTYGVAKALSDQYRVSLHALGVSGSGWPTSSPAAPQVDGLGPTSCWSASAPTTSPTAPPSARPPPAAAAGRRPGRVAPDAKVIVSGLPRPRPRPPSTGPCAT